MGGQEWYGGAGMVWGGRNGMGGQEWYGDALIRDTH